MKYPKIISQTDSIIILNCFSCSAVQFHLALLCVNFHKQSDMVEKFLIDLLHQVARPKKLLNSDAVLGGLASRNALSFCS
jgi:hypothetical protein